MTLSAEKIRSCDLLSPIRSAAVRRFSAASGAALVGTDGRDYLDLNEMCRVLGQNNRAFREAVYAALCGITSDKVGFSPAKEQLYRYLLESTNGDFSAIHLCTSGSESTEWAVRLAAHITGRIEVLSFWNSIHGRTYLSASMSGLPRRKAGCGILAPGLLFAPYPRCGVCPLRGRCGAGRYACLQLLEETARCSSSQSIAAVIAEPYQGCDVTFPPEGYLSALCGWAHAHGALFLMDEVQSGMGRTGEMYCYQHEGIKPDMLILGKALGNGMHISALLMRKRPPKSVLPAVSGGTGDETIACTAACEVFRQLENGLLGHIACVGRVLAEGLAKLVRIGCAECCRCRGLAAAVDFETEQKASGIFRLLLKQGFFVGHSGKAILLKPPYAVTEEQIVRFLAALEDAARKA